MNFLSQVNKLKYHVCHSCYLLQLVGKQPNRDVWVFNESIQMDKDGRRINEEDMEFIVIEDDRLPLLKNVSGG